MKKKPEDDELVVLGYDNTNTLMVFYFTVIVPVITFILAYWPN